MNIFSQHIPFEQLVNLAEGRVPPDQETRLREHLSQCAHCQAELAAVGKTITLMRSDDSVDAPPETIARAVRRFRPRPVPATPSLRERLAAVLTFDSGQMPLAVGVRATGSSSRQMLYTAGEYEIDLRLAPEGEHTRLAGQILGPVTQGVVQAQAAQSAPIRQPLTALGEFTLELLRARRYDLTVELAQHEIEIPDLDLS